jgi:hypothetical protein
VKLRLVQVCCLVILGFALKSSPVLARDPCPPDECCGSGEYCFVSGNQHCQDYGCKAALACGDDSALCDCEDGCIDPG